MTLRPHSVRRPHTSIPISAQRGGPSSEGSQRTFTATDISAK